MSEQRIQLQFTPDWRVTLLALLFLPLVISLGFWQLGRAEEKKQLLVAFEQKQAIGHLPIIDLDHKTDLSYQPVSLSGRYINDKSLLLDNRIYQGRVGYEIITPLELSANDQWVLVNRGWVAGSVDRRRLPTVNAVLGEVKLMAEVYVPLGEMMQLAEDSPTGWPRVVQTIDIESLAEEFGQPVFPYTVRLDVNSPGALQPNWLVVNIQPEKHTGYAVQWFGMGVALLVILLLANTNLWQLIRGR